ncbi:hypothetical protein M3Y97_00384900 [Aphelenchoides bicaudatus]|nr:hypothetical protein M3Y97_00384900 [Aphelenchoides bicaudatus]
MNINRLNMDGMSDAKSKTQSVDEVNRFLTEDTELSDLDDLDNEEPSTSNNIKANKAKTVDENDVPTKKARRNKEEIRQEKITKEINKIEREFNASKNSKCEQYLYCYCSNSILNLDPQLDNQLRQLFKERKIENQIVFEDMEFAKVYWKKKRISAELIDNAVLRKETFEIQFGFLIAVDGGSFKLMLDSKQYDDFINNALVEHCTKFEGDVQMTIAVIGLHNVSESKINALTLTIFEKYRVQLRFCRTAEDFSFLVAQMHRALAKFEKKMETVGTQLHINAEKGIREGENLVEDWWSRMLNHVYRLPEECRRAIIGLYPNPFVLMDKLDAMNPGTAMQHLADIMCDNGRRVGPAIAQKLYFILTSEDGTEIIDRPNMNS